ncbi:MAG: LacI family transcriptional regulator [Clostridia bacterium]|nr:LacI family transcriptional regulator [Clostridia bacterium]
MTNKIRTPNPTIYDIAKAAGVSPGTVSRTLNNIGYIKDETRQKIEKAMKDLKYIPNRAARTLKTKKTGLVMMAIPDTDNPFYVDMVKAVQDVVKYNGYSMILYYTEGKKSDEIKVLKMLHEHYADGLILINLSFSKEHLKEIERINCPLVLSSMCVSTIGGREEDRFDYVGVDTRKGMYLAVKHLIMQGHTSIGYIGGVKELEVFTERYEGYCSAFIESGLKVREDLVFWKNYSETTGYEASKYFISMKERPTAVCAANDMLALGALRAFEDSGIKVPEDVALVGMDNIDTASRVKPKLTTVSIAQSEIGRTAAELIYKRLNGDEKGQSKKIIFEPRLIVRDSSIIFTG